MGRVTGRQRSSITKQPQSRLMLLPWETRYQHRIEDFFKARHGTPNTVQGSESAALSHMSVVSMSYENSEPNAINCLANHQNNSSKDCSGLQVMEERQDQENTERETCDNSNDSSDGKVRLPTCVNASVQPAELHSPARKQERASETLTPLRQSSRQSEVAVNYFTKQSSAVLKSIKYAVHFNLDEIFNHNFAGGKVSLKQRLTNEIFG